MNTNQYTQKTLEALQAAQQLAVEYQHNALEPEHLLHALASQEQGLIPQLLQKLNVDPGSFAAAVAEKLSALPRVSGSGRDPDKVYISQRNARGQAADGHCPLKVTASQIYHSVKQ